MKQTLKQRITYLKQELAARGHQDGWLIQGLKKELVRLEKKQDNIKKSKQT